MELLWWVIVYLNNVTVKTHRSFSQRHPSYRVPQITVGGKPDCRICTHATVTSFSWSRDTPNYSECHFTLVKCLLRQENAETICGSNEALPITGDKKGSRLEKSIAVSMWNGCRQPGIQGSWHRWQQVVKSVTASCGSVTKPLSYHNGRLAEASWFH